MTTLLREFGAQVHTIMTDPRERADYWHDNKKELISYASLFVTLIGTWFLVSSGEFSFMLTIGSLVSMFSFGVMAICIETSRSCQGVSAKMLEIYFLLHACRLYAILPFEGYLPFDKSGDWFYQAVEVVSFLLVCVLLYQIRQRYPSQYSNEFDKIDIKFVIVPCVVLALFMHPRLNRYPPSDIAWAMALYLEAVAALPQLFMFQAEKKVHRWTAHFLFSQAVAKIIIFIFWIGTYMELNVKKHPSRQYMGYWALTVQGFQLLLVADFLVNYMRCVSVGKCVSSILQTV